MFFIPLVAVLAPLLARGLSPWIRVPIVVFELVLGILIGPDLLGWVQESVFVEHLADFGLATLFFVAGSEINFAAIRGRPLVRASLGWLASLVVGLAVGVLIAPGEPAVIIAIALSSTALGTLLPILRDAGELHTPFGRAATAIGAVGEFGPLVAISLFLGSRELGLSTVVLIGFIVLTGGAILITMRVPHGRLHRFVRATLHTSGQFAVRVIVLILALLVALSILLDLDMLLGAFAAGVVWQLIMRNAPKADREQVDSKVEAIAFGFLVPIFFVYTGVTFDLDALLASPTALALLPLFFGLLLIIRGGPSQLAVPPGASGRDRAALALLSATGLPIIVAVTAIGVDEGILSPALASALVGAGMLSVLVFPLVGMALRAHSSTRRSVALDAPPAEPTQEEA
ncbi:MAG TPA: cation:proton antiporter [Microbacterium sp.]|nr:cation:proton antiporter [Microbacterium sp.]HWI31223.1 cation:proton antiporter [Microbacterium sp.]